MSWNDESERHELASKGISTKTTQRSKLLDTLIPKKVWKREKKYEGSEDNVDTLYIGGNPVCTISSGSIQGRRRGDRGRVFTVIFHIPLPPKHDSWDTWTRRCSSKQDAIEYAEEICDTYYNGV